MADTELCYHQLLVTNSNLYKINYKIFPSFLFQAHHEREALCRDGCHVDTGDSVCVSD